MAKYVVEGASLIAIADSIREKTGKTASLTLAQMPTEIEGIIADLAVKNTELKAQNDELQTQVWNLTEEKEHLADEIENLNYNIENLTAENAELTERIEELESGSGGSSGEKTTLAEFLEGTSTEITAEDLQGCTSIKDYAGIDGYNGCFGNLTSVTIPASVTYIGEYAIPIGGISIILLGETPPTIYTNTFGYEDASSGMILPCTIYVPASAVDTYKTATNWSLYADWIQAIGGTESGGDSGESGGDYEPTDQTALAGAYTDATFTTRAYTWDELLERGDSTKNGGIYPYQNPPSAELAGYYCVYGENYAFVIPDTITTGVGTEGCRALVFPSTTTEFKTGMEGTIDTIYIKATTPPKLPWEDFFCDCNYNGNNGVQYAVNIVVPVGCGNAYKTATNWSNYADYITEGEMPI